MPRIRDSVDCAMAEVSQAARSAEHTAKLASNILERVRENGVAVSVTVSPATREALQQAGALGPVLLKLLDTICGVGLSIKPGEPATK